MQRLTINSDFDPVTTAYIVERVNRQTRMFKGFFDEPELVHSFDGEAGTVHVHLSRGAEGDTISITHERERPRLRLVQHG